MQIELYGLRGNFRNFLSISICCGVLMEHLDIRGLMVIEQKKALESMEVILDEFERETGIRFK